MNIWQALILASLPFWRRAPYAGMSDMRGTTGTCMWHTSSRCKKEMCKRHFKTVKFSNAPTDKQALCAAVAAVVKPPEPAPGASTAVKRPLVDPRRWCADRKCWVCDPNPVSPKKQVLEDKSCVCGRVFGDPFAKEQHLKDSSKCPGSLNYGKS